ncbi:MAG: NF038143 family protein [Desulfobacterales bacterium]
MDKSDIIISAEQQFAREVSLGVIYLRPRSLWYNLIPGMFLIDFLRRGSTTRKFTEMFMFPRQLAMQAAGGFSVDNSKASMATFIETEIRNWLANHQLDSQDSAKAQKGIVDILIDHYVRLLQAEGESYYDLIQNAYLTREKFESHLHDLTNAEYIMDQAILAKAGDEPAVKEKLQLEAQQVQNRRQKILEDIY